MLIDDYVTAPQEIELDSSARQITFRRGIRLAIAELQRWQQCFRIVVCRTNFAQIESHFVNHHCE